VKLADFGLSASYRYKVGYELKEKMGTAIFMAPEQINRKTYSKRVDMWACGIIMYMLIEGRHPLYETGDSEVKFLEKLKNPDWKFSSCFTEMATDLFLKLCTKTSVERYSANRALEHPWITRNFET
jgi:serine/threonine protein kinase